MRLRRYGGWVIYLFIYLFYCENFVDKRERGDLVSDAFFDSEPVERVQNGSDMTGLRILTTVRAREFWICWRRDN